MRTLPRRVRELVFVRWPRTGSPRVWRSPRADLMSLNRVSLGERADFLLLVGGELAALFACRNADLLQDVAGTRRTDTENERQ